MWPFTKKRSEQSAFAVGPYSLNESIDPIKDQLRPFSGGYIQRSFAGESIYEAPPINAIGTLWEVVIGTVNERIYKIALFHLARSKADANPIATGVLSYCEKELGKPSEQKTGLFVWDAADGNVILQTAETGEGCGINLFLTSSAVSGFTAASANQK
jgi:hypothetical protein